MLQRMLLLLQWGGGRTEAPYTQREAAGLRGDGQTEVAGGGHLMKIQTALTQLRGVGWRLRRGRREGTEMGRRGGTGVGE